MSYSSRRTERTARPGSRIRARDAQRLDDFDMIFVQREALMTRSTSFERRAAKSRAKLIFDFDDSTWLSNVSEANRFFRWMKNPEKTATLIESGDVVFAGSGERVEGALRDRHHAASRR